MSDAARPRPDPFIGFVRQLFYMGRVTPSMAQEVTPAAVAVQTYE